MLAIGFAALGEIEEAMNHLRGGSRGAPRGTDLPAGREWGVWKGVHLDPETSTLEAPVYLPGDANCCPSFVARARLRVTAEAVHTDAVTVIPDTGSGPWILDPVEGAGPCV